MPGSLELSSSASLSAQDESLLERVRDAQESLLFRRVQTTTLAGVAFALLVVIGLLPYVNPHWLWAWFALRCVASAARMFISRRFFDAPPEQRARWHGRFLGVLAPDGLTWGLMVIWLAPPPQQQIVALLLTALIGLAAMGMFVLQSSWKASFTFLAFLLAPVAVHQMWMEGRFGLFVGLALLMYLGLVLLEARRAEARIRELLILRYVTDSIAEERAQALLLAQRQSSVKSQFLATMSHEMRTPLHGILGLTRMLQNEPGSAPGEKLALIERAGQHLLTLINDILDFSKLEAGQVQLVEQDFDLAALIDEVVSLSAPAAAEQGLELSVRPHMPRPCWVRGDPARLRQVLHNLIGNAVKFTDTGAVTVVARHSHGRTRIAVHDTGVGISADELPRIFDAFHQADSSFKRRFAGTGLGLTIARELARAMGGDLVCTSEPGRGSCFTLTLALQAAQAAPPENAERTEGTEAARAGVGGEALRPELKGHVLLAEDNPVNALVAESALKRMGLTVELVSDGAQALKAFCHNPPDLVLLDCQMPGMDGFEAARRMRAHEAAKGLPRTPMVALTANTLAGDREQSLAAGMDEHLAKPFHDDELRAMLGRLMAP